MEDDIQELRTKVAELAKVGMMMADGNLKFVDWAQDAESRLKRVEARLARLEEMLPHAGGDAEAHAEKPEDD